MMTAQYNKVSDFASNGMATNGGKLIWKSSQFFFPNRAEGKGTVSMVMCTSPYNWGFEKDFNTDIKLHGSQLGALCL